MYAAGRGAVRLLLVVTFVVAVADALRQPRQSRSKTTNVYRPNKNVAKLLDHVKMYEEKWVNVLQEPILLLDEPPYKGRDLGQPPLMPMSEETSSGVTEKMYLYDVHDIVAKVTKYYGAIRSFVEFGAKVVRRALACYTFKRVFLQSKIIYNLLIKEAEPNIVLQVATTFKKENVSSISILSAIPDNDLSIILLAYWESIKLLQYDGIQYLEKELYPKTFVKNMRDLIEKTSNFLITYCRSNLTDKEFYLKAGILTNIPLITIFSPELVITVEQLVTMNQELVLYMARTTGSLGIVTMSDNLWTSLFFYHGYSGPDSTYLDVVASPSSEAGHCEVSQTMSEAGHSEVSQTTSEAGPSKVSETTSRADQS